MSKPSLSIIVPCLNEEGNIKDTVASIKEALGSTGRFADYEILIFNDGSTDNTGKIIDSLEKTEKGVKAIHNPKNMGFGYNYTEGVRAAKNDYIIMIPGDNEIPSEAIKKVFGQAGKADVIIPYTANQNVRKPARRIVSKVFVALMNTLFGLRLNYYNGTCIIKSSLLKKVPLKTWGFAYMAAILVRLLRSGASYLEVGVEIKPRETGKSKAFAPRNVASVLWALSELFWDVRIKDRDQYSAPARRVKAA